jgi:hypothetical protein
MAQTLDTSIYQNLLNIRTPESFSAERQQVEAARLANALNSQKVDAYKQEQNLLNTIRTARQRGASADELVGIGDYEGAKERQSFDQNKVEEGRKAEKWTQEKAKFVLGVQKDLAGKVMANPSSQAALSAIAEMERISEQNMDAERQAIAMLQTPDDIRKWAAGHALSAEQMLPKFETLNTGDAVQDRMRDPITGAITVTGKSKLNMAPGQAAQLSLQRDQFAESKRHNMATEGIASQRAVAGPAPGGGKPLPVGALKMQQEAADAIGIAGGIQADLGAVLGQIESGELQLGPVRNLVNAGKNLAGLSDQGSKNFASLKATLEKLRNDSLRLNKGVQTDGDAQRAWNELLANINDPGVVTQRLREIQALNERAVEAHEMNLDMVRGNYGAPPIDTASRRSPKPAVGGGATGAWGTDSKQPAKTKAGASVSNW